MNAQTEIPECSIEFSGISFGEIPKSSSSVIASLSASNILVYCSKAPAGFDMMRTCIGFGEGVHPAQNGLRVLKHDSSDSYMSFELYSDPNRASPFPIGAIDWVVIDRSATSLGSVNGEPGLRTFHQPIWGTAYYDPVSNYPGIYLSYLSTPAGLMFRVAYYKSINSPPDCESIPLVTMEGSSPGMVKARALPFCEITATSGIDFGAIGSLSAPVYGAGSITVTCDPQSNYYVYFDYGLNANLGPPTAQRFLRRQDGNELIPYALFRDPGYHLPLGILWGSHLANTGSGLPQTLAIYAKIDAQTDSFPLGLYSDTVVVTLQY